MASELEEDEAWNEFNRNTPEAHWDVAVWPLKEPGGIEPSIRMGYSLDVAERRRIWLDGYRYANRKKKGESDDAVG